MKGIKSNGFLPIIAQAIAEMEETHGEFSSIDEVNLAELGRRTGLSRAKLRRLKANGFCEKEHGLNGQKRESILDGYLSFSGRRYRSPSAAHLSSGSRRRLEIKVRCCSATTSKSPSFFNQSLQYDKNRDGALCSAPSDWFLRYFFLRLRICRNTRPPKMTAHKQIKIIAFGSID